MTRKTRFIVLGSCIVLFLVATPYIVLHSLGYRIDFRGKQVVATGGIYIKALPLGAEITVDDSTSKTSIFSNDVFVQNLVSKTHAVSIQRDGYHTYQKNLTVKEKEVTKLEHVVLIKENIPFERAAENVDYFSLSPDGNMLLLATIEAKQMVLELVNTANPEEKRISFQAPKGPVSEVIWANGNARILAKVSNTYVLVDNSVATPTVVPLPLLHQTKDIFFNPQNPEEIFFIKNGNLNSNLKTIPVIKNVTTYRIDGQTIMFLSSEGLLQTADLQGNNMQKLSKKPLKIKDGSSYEIFLVGERLFISEDNRLLRLDSGEAFEKLDASADDILLSPDHNKILYCNDKENLLTALNPNTSYLVSADPSKLLALNTFTEEIKNCSWLNDDYILFSLGDSFAISEIDSRDKVNLVRIWEIMDQDNPVKIKNPHIMYSAFQRILYLLSERNLYISNQVFP